MVFIQSVIYIFFLSRVSTIKEFDTLQCPPFTVVSHVEADVANPVLRGQELIEIGHGGLELIGQYTLMHSSLTSLQWEWKSSEWDLKQHTLTSTVKVIVLNGKHWWLYSEIVYPESLLPYTSWQSLHMQSILFVSKLEDLILRLVTMLSQKCKIKIFST